MEDHINFSLCQFLYVALRIELVLRINYVRTSITVSDFLMVIDNVISLSTSLLQIHLLSSTGHSDAGRFTEHNLGQAGKTNSASYTSVRKSCQSLKNCLPSRRHSLLGNETSNVGNADDIIVVLNS